MVFRSCGSKGLRAACFGGVLMFLDLVFEPRIGAILEFCSFTLGKLVYRFALGFLSLYQNWFIGELPESVADPPKSLELEAVLFLLGVRVVDAQVSGVKNIGDSWSCSSPLEQYVEAHGVSGDVELVSRLLVGYPAAPFA
ncbi:hypothetical protein Droror1_Dr00023841 [Drosera rotundifolia]